MRSLLRSIGHVILTLLARATIIKHEPRIVAIVGHGETSIEREMIFQALNTTYPVSKSIEVPLLEFSLPLSIIGVKHYPKSLWEWLKLVPITLAKLLVFLPYDHIMVLDVVFHDPQITHYWLRSLNPEVIVVTEGEASDYEEYDAKVIGYAENLDCPECAYVETAVRVAKYFEIEEDIVRGILATMPITRPRLALISGINGSTIIDAGYHYFPAAVESILELAPSQSGRKIFLTDTFSNSQGRNLKELLSKDWQVNPSKLIPQPKDVIVIRAQYHNLLENYGHLIAGMWPDTYDYNE